LLDRDTYFVTDFRVIPLGDLNLLQEIGIDRGADVVHRKNGGKSVRRMYTARVHGCKSNMTVALYQGNGAEDVCFLFSWVNPVLILIHRDGGSTSHDIQTFGESIHSTILMKNDDGLDPRHAYLAQLYGIVNTRNLHAAVFHDGQDLLLAKGRYP
jgi:hypothetical protein